MARNTLKLEMSGFEELITQLEGLGGDVKAVVTDALTQAAETVTDDTKDAVKAAFLPAKGKYSKGKTQASIVTNPKVTWSGSMAEIGLGFDYSKEGAGGFLITGTPKMKPDTRLKEIYKSKRYMRQLQEDMSDIVNDAIEDALGG